MSQTLSLVCHDCEVVLLVGQHSNDQGWYIYFADDRVKERLCQFVNVHLEHSVSFISDEGCMYDEFDPSK